MKTKDLQRAIKHPAVDRVRLSSLAGKNAQTPHKRI